MLHFLLLFYCRFVLCTFSDGAPVTSSRLYAAECHKTQIQYGHAKGAVRGRRDMMRRF